MVQGAREGVRAWLAQLWEHIAIPQRVEQGMNSFWPELS
jgi:hypothetical protein